MTERIFRSAIDALVGRFLSAPASWLKDGFFLAQHVVDDATG